MPQWAILRAEWPCKTPVTKIDYPEYTIKYLVFIITRYKSCFVFPMMCPRILIIEDDDDIRELCRDILETEGFSVETCINGQEALSSLDNYPDPCLIFLDMLMPIMSGTEFMTEFAKRPHTIVPIPVYLVSATAQKIEGKNWAA